jgi:signal transduction histidine kinase
VLRRQSAAREKELLAEAAVAGERLRIARELHDAVGHDVSLMVVQAEALGAVTGDERADAIAALGRRTMGEMHRTLKVLRDAELAPQPGLGDLGGVIEDGRGAGGGGHGPIGMRERVAAFNGTLHAGRRAGGFEVRAEMPYR